MFDFAANINILWLRLLSAFLLQGSPLKVVSSKDTLSRHDLVNVADELFSHSSAKISELAVNLGIPEPDLCTLKQFCTAEDYPLLILLEWKKRGIIASRPQLISALLECGLRALAMKLDSASKQVTCQIVLDS